MRYHKLTPVLGSRTKTKIILETKVQENRYGVVNKFNIVIYGVSLLFKLYEKKKNYGFNQLIGEIEPFL